MSDLVIPGVTSNLNTQKIMDALMTVEKVPLTRMQQEQTANEKKKSAWQDFTRKLSVLRDGARTLFSFDNPFNNKIVETSDSKVLSAAADRTAVEEIKNIVVKQMAKADRFQSQALPKDFSVEAGEYTFTVGDKRITFTYKGGSLKDFADTANKRGADLLSLSVIPDSSTTQVLVIESKKTGAKNRLIFSGKSADLALKTGIIERSATASRQISLTQKGIQTWAKPLSPDMYDITNGALTLNPGSELRIPVQPQIALNQNMVLELSIKTASVPEPQAVELTPPPGPAIPETGSVQLQGITIQSGRSEAPLPEWTPPQPPEKLNDMQVLFMEGSGKLVSLPEITDSTDFQTIQIPVGELANSLDSLDLRNRNTYRRITVKDISVFDKTQRGDYLPRRPISQAADSILTMDGIDVRRDSNQVDDLIPGVRLHIAGERSSPVELKVTRDADAIKKGILNFIGSYDGIITDINVLTRRDESVIAAATYLTDDEKKKAADNLGLLMGDLSLQQIKDSMQRIVMSPYPTSLGRDLSLLAQIGISTDSRKPGAATGIDQSRLLGYLEVDEPKLDAEIGQYPEAMKELFGSDTNGDLVVNAGVAFAMDALIKPYVQIGGILPAKVSNLDSEITRKKREITDYQQHLDDYQAQLKQKYAAMEGALQQMQRNSDDITNFTKNNSSSSQ
jgi:flagellar hook-associated protein 2